MRRGQVYKFELKPNGEQQWLMRRFAGSCRFVHNTALATQQERYKAGEKRLGHAGLCKVLTVWRNSTETAWRADVPVHPLQQTLKDLERAYTNFFAKRADVLPFRKNRQSHSFRYPHPKQIRLDQANNRLFLPRLGWPRYHNSQQARSLERECCPRPSMTTNIINSGGEYDKNRREHMISLPPNDLICARANRRTRYPKLPALH